MGEKALFAKHPAARGYLRAKDGYRLMDRREGLVTKLLLELKRHEQSLRAGVSYPLAPVDGGGKKRVKKPAAKKAAAP